MEVHIKHTTAAASPVQMRFLHQLGCCRSSPLLFTGSKTLLTEVSRNLKVQFNWDYNLAHSLSHMLSRTYDFVYCDLMKT